MNYTLYIILIILCLLLSAFFSATETAFSAMNKIRIKTLADKGNKRAKLTLKLDENFDKLLSTILIGNNIVNILAASLSTLIFVFAIGTSIGPTISTIVLTVVVLIFGEVSPKTIAKECPEKFAMLSAPIINALIIVFTPVNFLFSLWKKLLGKIFKTGAEQAMTEEELISIVEEAEEDGGIDQAESDLIISAIEFNELEVGDIYTPRIDVLAIPEGTSKDTVAKTFASTGYSRIPVYKGDIDNVIGILYYKDFYNLCFTSEQTIENILKPVSYVAKTQKLSEVLKYFQNEQIHLAIVMDEFGSTAGIVTMEDILEEIVGDIWDEHDKIIEDIKKTSDNSFLVSGKAGIEKLFDLLEIESDLDVLTVNGWVMDELKCIPTEGMAFNFKGIDVKVLKVNKRRVETLEVVDNRPKEQEEA